ncbi:MAG: hypothetical protein V4615_14150, partial [Bacteroidota bacterium]
LPQLFEEQEKRLEKSIETFNHRVALRKDEQLTPAETEQFRKIEKTRAYFVEVIEACENYVPVFKDTDEKGDALLDLVLDEKKQDEVLDNIARFEQLYGPANKEMFALKKRCDAIDTMLDEIELLLKRELN